MNTDQLLRQQWKVHDAIVTGLVGNQIVTHIKRQERQRPSYTLDQTLPSLPLSKVFSHPLKCPKMACDNLGTLNGLAVL